MLASSNTPLAGEGEARTGQDWPGEGAPANREEIQPGRQEGGRDLLMLPRAASERSSGGGGGSWPLRATSTHHKEKHRAGQCAGSFRQLPALQETRPQVGALSVPLKWMRQQGQGHQASSHVPQGNPSPAGGRGAPGGRDVEEGSLLGQGRDQSGVMPLRPPPPRVKGPGRKGRPRASGRASLSLE